MKHIIIVAKNPNLAYVSIRFNFLYPFFVQANDKELKGRVIKTARRRNAADGGEKKNVFAGFGGFSSSTPATTNSFSFLAKPEAIDLPKTDANAAVFGSANKTDSASPFLFGSGNAAEPTKPSFGQFSFGKSSKEEKPLSSSFTSLENKSEPKDDLLDKFKAKPGSWSCDVCMISNPADKIKCAACETPKPGAKQPESNSSKASFGDSGGFKFGSGNSGTSPAVFGTKSGETGGTGFGTSFGSSASSVAPTSGFKFGSSAVKDSERESPKPTGGFSFGSAEKSKDTSSSGFVFGAPATEKSTSSVFAFGSNSNPKPASVPAFGTNESSAKSSSFSFGSGSSTPSSEKVSKPVGFAFMSNSKDTTEPKSSKAEFSFGSKSSESGATVNLNGKSSEFGASVSSTPILGSAKSAESSFGNSSSKDNVESNEYNEDYLAHLKALNLQVTEWIKRHVEENPLVLLSPVFLDYEKHLKVISEKYQTKTPAKENSSGTTSFQISPSVKSPVKPSESIKPFSFAASSENKTEPAKFAFGSEAGTKLEPASSGFSFGLASKPAGEGFSFGSGCGGGFGTPAPSQPVSATQLEEDEDSPPVVEVKQVDRNI